MTRAERETATVPSPSVLAYARFGSWVFEMFWQDGEPGDIEGGDAQEAAIRFGLLGRTSEVDAGATHAEDCEWVPEAPANECSCYVPMFPAIRALAEEDGK